jgi:hypothetical protein
LFNRLEDGLRGLDDLILGERALQQREQGEIVTLSITL